MGLIPYCAISLLMQAGARELCRLMAKAFAIVPEDNDLFEDREEEDYGITLAKG